MQLWAKKREFKGTVSRDERGMLQHIFRKLLENSIASDAFGFKETFRLIPLLYLLPSCETVPLNTLECTVHKYCLGACPYNWLILQLIKFVTI